MMDRVPTELAKRKVDAAIFFRPDADERGRAVGPGIAPAQATGIRGGNAERGVTGGRRL